MDMFLVSMNVVPNPGRSAACKQPVLAILSLHPDNFLLNKQISGKKNN